MRPHRIASVPGRSKTYTGSYSGAASARRGTGQPRTVLLAAASGAPARGEKRPPSSRRADADDDLWTASDGDSGARPATARRLKMVVAYDGSEFAGFQFQPGKVRTVQGELERCAKRLFHGSSRMVGASRTDGGAHAYGQVVHFDVYGTRDSLESDTLYYNSFLPQDVRVIGLSYAEDGFDSHFSSCGKTYLYKMSAGLPDPLQSKYRWWLYDRWCERSRGKPGRLSDVELDVGLMQQAAEMLLGRHDFSAFMDNKRPAGLGSAKRKNPKLAERGIKPERTAAKNTRILSHLTLTEGVSPVSGGQEVVMEVTGNGFLYRMVRMLAAGLVEVGHRRLTPAGLRELLARADRAALPEAAPPHGLYLARVHYPGDPQFEDRIQSLTDRIQARNIGNGSGPGSGSGATPTCSSQVGTGSGEGHGRAAELLPQLPGRNPWGGDRGGKGVVVWTAGEGSGAVGVDGAGPAVAVAVDEAESVAQELRMTQGQKAAALMRAAAAERRGAGAEGGDTGGWEDGDGDGGAAVAAAEGTTGGAESVGRGSAAPGSGGSFVLGLRDREDDQ